MRRKVHYVIHPAYLWNSIHERARTQDPELLQTLERAFQYIEGGVLNLYYPDRMGNGCRTLRNGCLWVSKWIMLQKTRPQQVALSQSAGACGGSLAARNQARRSLARRLPRSL